MAVTAAEFTQHDVAVNAAEPTAGESGSIVPRDGPCSTRPASTAESLRRVLPAGLVVELEGRRIAVVGEPFGVR